MKGQEIIDFVTEEMGKLRAKRLEDEEKARIDLLFERNFKPTLFGFLECSKEPKVAFTRGMVTNEKCDYNLLQMIDDTLKAEIYRKGYKFVEEESTPDTLVFQRR